MSDVQHGHVMPNAAAQPAMEYDGADTPVLIKIPDLSPASPGARVSSLATSSNSPSPAATPVTGRPVRGRRRIHRSHLPQGPKAPAPISPPSPKRSSKSYLAVLLIALTAGYFFFGRGDDDPAEPGEADRWAASPAKPETSQEKETPPPDLWPGDKELAESDTRSSKPTAEPSGVELLEPPGVYQSSVYPSESGPSQARSSDTRRPPHMEEPSSPALAAPAQQEWLPQSESQSWPAESGRGFSPSGWPELPAANGNQPVAPTHNVSFPQFNEGANSTSTQRPPLATISGLRARPNAERRPQLQLQPSHRIATPLPPKNHERLQTSLH